MLLSERLCELKSGQLALFTLEIHQELGEPRTVAPAMKATDQPGAISVGPLKDMEELTGRRHPEGGHNPPT